MRHKLHVNVHRPEFLLRISGISTKTPIIVESEPVTRTQKLHNYVFDPKKSMSEQEKTRIGTVRHLPSHLQAEKNQAQSLHARIGRNHQQASISRWAGTIHSFCCRVLGCQTIVISWQIELRMCTQKLHNYEFNLKKSKQEKEKSESSSSNTFSDEVSSFTYMP